jgi:hypothetical protein
MIAENGDQSGCKQLFNLIERDDYFASCDQLLEVVAVEELLLFEKVLPEIGGYTA